MMGFLSSFAAKIVIFFSEKILANIQYWITLWIDRWIDKRARAKDKEKSITDLVNADTEEKRKDAHTNILN